MFNIASHRAFFMQLDNKVLLNVVSVYHVWSGTLPVVLSRPIIVAIEVPVRAHWG
jgi:hypothetical protein